MTVEDKQAFIRRYCATQNCLSGSCVVGRIATEEFKAGITDTEVCYSTNLEELLDRRIAAIEAVKKPTKEESATVPYAELCTPAEKFVVSARESKIGELDEHCDSTTCRVCPCNTDDLKKYCVDGHTCDFDEMSDEGLDAYLKVIGAAKEKALAAARSLKIRRLNGLCGDQAEVCPECPCRELAKEAGTATLCCFEDMDDAMLDKYLAKFSDAATLSETATLSGGGCSGHKVAPPTETSLKDAIHPHHYKLPGGMQVVDVEVAMFGREAVMAHCLCTAAEYILRSQQKNGVEDIKKAHWWLCEYLELEAEGHVK